MKKSDLSKTYRVRGEFVESVKEKSLDFLEKNIKKQSFLNFKETIQKNRLKRMIMTK